MDEVLRKRNRQLLGVIGFLVITMTVTIVLLPLSGMRSLYSGKKQREISEAVYAIPAALNAIGSALIVGDEKRWLEVLDPTDAKLREEFRGYFAALRKAKVSAWYVGLDPQQLLRERELTQATLRVWFVYCVRGTVCGSVAAKDSGQLDPKEWRGSRSFGASVQWILWQGHWRIDVFLPDNRSLGGALS